MYKRLTTFFSFQLFENKNHNKKYERYAAMFFLVFMFVGLAFDSTQFSDRYFDGRWLMNIISIGHFLVFFYVASTKLRKLMFVMVPLSYLGELIFCDWFNMYDYRLNQIPLYVPFGHAVLYATGYVTASTEWAQRHQERLTKFFIVFFVLATLGVAVLFNDMLSLIYGIGFFFLMKRYKWANFYFFMSVWVIILELVGTYYQCWGWHSVVFGAIPTVNPPLGAFFIYVCGDVVLNKLVRRLDRKRTAVSMVSS